MNDEIYDINLIREFLENNYHYIINEKDYKKLLKICKKCSYNDLFCIKGEPITKGSFNCMINILIRNYKKKEGEENERSCRNN